MARRCSPRGERHVYTALGGKARRVQVLAESASPKITPTPDPSGNAAPGDCPCSWLTAQGHLRRSGTISAEGGLRPAPAVGRETSMTDEGTMWRALEYAHQEESSFRRASPPC